MESTRNSSLIVGCAAIAVLAVCALAAAVLFGPQTIGSEGASHAQTSVSASLATPSVLIPLGGLLSFTVLVCGIGFYLGNRRRPLERVEEPAIDD